MLLAELYWNIQTKDSWYATTQHAQFVLFYLFVFVYQDLSEYSVWRIWRWRRLCCVVPIPSNTPTTNSPRILYGYIGLVLWATGWPCHGKWSPNQIHNINIVDVSHLYLFAICNASCYIIGTEYEHKFILSKLVGRMLDEGKKRNTDTSNSRFI